MRLISLEIKGFKSFADKTIINFNENIVGIVGPNGCGKSNVIDAIRWALGEQRSSELRSEKMSNIIFNGTKKRKPSGLAEVSLTFENTKNILPTAYTTVTITRQLFRSGESEYRLNGVVCRLKDITSLFIDTGIGSNSYAIIELRMIGDLLKDKENSRRKIFEQAAGISKYKIRKRETMLKLKGTKADLDRVEDLLFEIAGNLKKLERQAKRTQKFYELKKDYKELSLENSVFEIADFKQKHKTLERQLREEQDKSIQVEKQIHELDAAIQKAKAASIMNEKNLSAQQRVLNETVGIIRAQENEKKVLRQKLNFVKQNQKNLQNAIQRSTNRLGELDLNIKNFSSSIETERAIEKSFQENLAVAKEDLERIKAQHGAARSELDKFVTQQRSISRAVFDLEKKQAINKSQVDNLRRDLTRNDADIERRQQEINTIQDKIQGLHQLQITQEEAVKDLEVREEQRLKDIESTNESIETIQDKTIKINRQLDAYRTEYKLTKSLIDSFEGFPESIKFLSKNAKWDKKAPLLSDIIYCQADYRLPIENYLGNYLNYYVVRDVEEAVAAIQLLSQSKKGKANFFLLDKFQDIATSTTPTQEGLTAALDVIEVDKEAYKQLCRHLLGNVFIEEQNIAMTEQLPEGITVIAKNGKYVRQKFSISGGSVGAFEGKRIGRKKNLEYLSQQIEKLKAESTTFTKELQELKQTLRQLKSQDKRHQIQKQKANLERLKREGLTLGARKENFETFITEAGEKKERLNVRISEIETKTRVIEDELAVKAAEEKVLRSQVDKMDNSVKGVARQLSDASNTYNQSNISFIRQQNKTKTIERELTFAQKQEQELSGKLAADTRNLEKRKVEGTTTQEQIIEIEKMLILKYEERGVMQEGLNEAEQLYYKDRGAINDLEDKQRNSNKERQNVQFLISSIKDKLNEHKIKLNSIIERLKIEFGIMQNEIINRRPNPDYEPSELRLKVEKLKRRLDTYGEINPLAIEAYEEIKQRHDFILEQKEDLVKAEKSLLDTIEEIEGTATQQFMDAFEKVRAHFKEVFRSLFTDDDICDLLLDDPKNPLESRIKIIARPKGKRPLTINQLSGGEKTLTATALLFSLYLLKPAPFCIFDEVDAPLDDANIDKFNNIIQKFSKDSQFIIVTHNKKTMTAVDIIYGVSMQEMGVSSVVPVDFRNLS